MTLLTILLALVISVACALLVQKAMLNLMLRGMQFAIARRRSAQMERLRNSGAL